MHFVANALSLHAAVRTHAAMYVAWHSAWLIVACAGRHMCMCGDCATELRKQTSKCPICREQVDSLLHIKMQKTSHKVPTGAAAAAAAQKIEELKV